MKLCSLLCLLLISGYTYVAACELQAQLVQAPLVQKKALQPDTLLALVKNTFTHAVRYNNVPYFLALCKGLPLSPNDASQLLPLAASQGHVAAACELLKKGADVNHEQGRPLKEAATRKHKPLVEALLRYGAQASLCEKRFIETLDPEIAVLVLRAKMNELESSIVGKERIALSQELWQADEKERRKMIPSLESEAAAFLLTHDNNLAHALCALAKNEKGPLYLIPRLLSHAARTHALNYQLMWMMLNSACTQGNMEYVRALLDWGILPDVQATVGDHYSPLMCAIEAGHLDIVRLLLTHPRTQPKVLELLSQKNRLGETPLIVACSKRHLPLTDDVLMHTDNEKEAYRLLESYRMSAKLLLDLGSGINDYDNKDYTAFAHALCAYYEPTIELLLNHPRCKNNDQSLVLNYGTQNGITPIMCVCMEGNIDSFYRALDAGAVLGAGGNSLHDNNGYTAFLHAAAHGRSRIMRALFDLKNKYHIDPLEERNNAGQNGLFVACLHNQPHAVQTFIEQSKSTGDLYSWYWIRDGEGRNAVCLAAQMGLTEVLGVLLYEGRFNRLRYYDNAMALRQVIDYQAYEHIFVNGIIINRLKNAALHFAAEAGHLEAVKLLCDYNADTELRGRDNLTPYELAVRAQKKDVAEYLKFRGGAPVSQEELNKMPKAVNVVVLHPDSDSE